jgi:hypothetical protein
MKKSIVFAVLILFFLMLPGQEQIPVLADEPPQVQAEEQPPAPPVQVQGRDLKRVHIPQAFIHAGKEYPAGDYWMVLVARDGKSYFVVQSAGQEPLFEELAIVKPRRGGGGFLVSKQMTADGEYFRVRVSLPREWLLGYFLVKK